MEYGLDKYLPIQVPKRTAKEIALFKKRLSIVEKQSIYERFIENGILKLISMKDFLSNWRYIGGSSGKHSDYLKFIHGIELTIEDIDILQVQCICGVKICNRVFISDGNRVITIGIECVVTFFEEDCRKNIKNKCTNCGEYHRNRIGTLCSDCREAVKPWNETPKTSVRTYSRSLDSEISIDNLACETRSGINPKEPLMNTIMKRFKPID
jgi:hypothetical protein